MNHLGGQGYSRLDKVATKGTMFIWLSFCMCTRRKPPKDLEIEQVSRTMASVNSHMLNGLWLSQLHSGRPLHWHLLRLTGFMYLKYILTLVPARQARIVYWEDFYGKTLSHSRSAGTPFGVYLSSGHWWRQDEIVSCG